MPRRLLSVLVAVFLGAAAPWAVAFDGIRLTVLASGNNSGGGVAAGPSVLVEAGAEVLLFDCGSATVARLKDAGVPLRDLTAVFLTSLDAEHTDGCAEVFAGRAALRSAKPLPVWGPGGIDAIAQQQQWPGSGAAPSDIVENVVYRTDEVTVTAFVTDYPAQPASFGFRVDHAGRAVALSGGTRYSEDVIRYARNVQVLVHEVALAPQEQIKADAHVRDVLASHTSPEEAGKVFRAAHPYLAIYAHVQQFGAPTADLVWRTRRYYRGPLEIAHDLMIVEVQNEVQLRGSPSDGRRDGSSN